MPAKNTVKIYLSQAYYHIYNRGVNKRRIFIDEQDYSVFLSYVKTYLSPKDVDGLNQILTNPSSSPKQKHEALQQLQLNNFYNRITLLAYILMTNHFHFLIRQQNERDVKIFMQSLMTRYTRYFNKRHKRVGSLFQGIYRAVTVETDEQLLYLTRYIHRNDLDFRQPSSYPNYLGKLNQGWVKPEFVLQHFSQSGFNSYREFVEADDTETELETVRLAGAFYLE